ncbi:HlyD family secretion protein [Geomonas subterranea]|uniref:HlyD family secretion protein n=1 Tax=Geomonas subterranea TaxID=2847989 RepID=UPI001CD49B7D|nr:HlyD family secretion protein [Geomonas fuzhouensis]
MDQVLEDDIPIPATARMPSRYRALLFALALTALAAAGSVRWWLWEAGHVRTDNAFVEGSSTAISPRVGGMVRRVLVQDNQYVRHGELLVELEPEDFGIAVRKAEADLGVVRDESSADLSRIGGAEAAADIARVRLAQAERDLKRAEELFRQDIVAREQVEQLATARLTAQHQLKEAEQAWRKARAEAGLERSVSATAKVRAKQAALEEARRQLAFTRIVAPCDGYVTRKAVEPGSNVEAGRTLLTLVSLQQIWVTANLKEGQVAGVRPGLRVSLTADAYPGRTFHGRVDSIMAGAGAAFSVLPPENATGNFVKVVQRIPVKIALEPGSDPGHLLRVGMSVVPTIELEPEHKQVAGAPFVPPPVPLP